MFCGQCGKQVHDDAQFCGSCGAAVSGEDGDVTNRAPETPPAPPTIPKEARTRLWVLLGVLIAAVAGGLIYALVQLSNWAGETVARKTKEAAKPFEDLAEFQRARETERERRRREPPREIYHKTLIINEDVRYRIPISLKCNGTVHAHVRVRKGPRIDVYTVTKRDDQHMQDKESFDYFPSLSCVNCYMLKKDAYLKKGEYMFVVDNTDLGTAPPTNFVNDQAKVGIKLLVKFDWDSCLPL